MANQYKIPQNIEVEDKILGPFTLRQFLYMIGGGVITYFLFLTIGSINLSIFIAIAVPVVLLTVALVFIRINGRPFLTFLNYFFAYLRDPKILKWEKSTRIRSIMVQSESESEKSRKEISKRTRKGLVKSRLEALANIVDTQGWSGKVDEDVGMSGRIISASEAESTVRTTLREEEPLEDVFADLEEAMEKITTKKTIKEEEGFEDLAAGISSLIAKR